MSLLEVLIAVVIIGILATLLIPVYGQMRARAQKVQCVSNLKQLHVATGLYIQQNGAWPAIETAENQTKTPEEKAELWLAALKPFGIQRVNWICPTIQDLLQNPDYSTPETARIDYIAMPFDDKAMTPYQWPTQPWFIETGDVHGNGNLIIFTDGSVKALNDVQMSGPPGE